MQVQGKYLKDEDKNIISPITSTDTVFGSGGQNLTNILDNVKSLNSVPVGTIIEYVNSTIPEGWLLCNGAEISRTRYSELFSVIGTTYGEGDGITTFNLPLRAGYMTTSDTNTSVSITKYFIIKSTDVKGSINTGVITNVHSESDTNVYSCNYINNNYINSDNITKSNAMTIGITGNYTIQTTGENKILFNTIVGSVGDKLSFRNNSIYIGDGITKIKLCSQLTVNTAESTRITDAYNLAIYKNNQAVSVSLNSGVTDTLNKTINTEPIIIPVTGGDCISVTGYFSSGDTVSTYENRTYLTVEAINEYVVSKVNILPQPNKLVVFGDSWSDLSVAAATWSTLAASSLNCTLKNYAKNGAGFVSPSTNLISTQIQTFIDDTTYEKDTVKYIVLMGGINDYRNNVSLINLRDTIESNINTLKNTCPNAKILYVSNCQYPFTGAQSGYWLPLHNHLSTLTGITTYNLDGTIGLALWNSSNYFHPTDNGSKYIGRNIVSCLTGGEIVTYTNNYTYSDSNGKINCVIYRQGNIAHLDFEITFYQSITSWTTNTISPNICYYDLLPSVFGSLTQGYKRLLMDISNGDKIMVAVESAATVNKLFRVSITAPIPYTAY